MSFPDVSFRYKPAQPKVCSGLRKRIVAAIRWDFEVGLVSTADLVEKYRRVASADQVRGIVGRLMDPDVPPARAEHAWQLSGRNYYGAKIKGETA